MSAQRIEGYVIVSADGDKWTPIETGHPNPDFPITDIAYGNGVLVATGSDGFSGYSVLTSPDAIQWTARQQRGIQCITFANDRFIAAGFQRRADDLGMTSFRWPTIP